MLLALCSVRRSDIGNATKEVDVETYWINFPGVENDFDNFGTFETRLLKTLSNFKPHWMTSAGYQGSELTFPLQEAFMHKMFPTVDPLDV
jgi:hypothetical protein